MIELFCLEHMTHGNSIVERRTYPPCWNLINPHLWTFGIRRCAPFVLVVSKPVKQSIVVWPTKDMNSSNC